MDHHMRDFLRDPFNGDGTLLSNGPYLRTWVGEDADGNMVKCDVSYTGPILDANKKRMNESSGKRWGDGQVVASIPLDIFFRDYNTARMNGDDAWVRRFLNDSDNEKFRTFGGTV